MNIFERSGIEAGETAVEVLAIHGFPSMWWADAPNWCCFSQVTWNGRKKRAWHVMRALLET